MPIYASTQLRTEPESNDSRTKASLITLIKSNS